MKATGIVRQVDQLGRVVLPKELRKVMHIKKDDGLEVFVDGDTIILRKYEPCCILCGNARDNVNYKGKNICRDCISEF